MRNPEPTARTLNGAPATPGTVTDARHMARALRLASRGLYTTDPNPRVGCVLVSPSGDVVGEGWHEFAGGAHAEVEALRQAGDRARGATAYVTLEPCAHHGRTPPCVDALIEAGVSRVVAAMDDPDPRVAGQGVARLRAAGIEVDTGVAEAAAQALNRGFVARLTRGWPWVRLKMAASLDGRTALASGESQWITGEQARLDVQRWRARSSAIVTGAGTLRSDDPALNVRLAGVKRQPLRVVVAGRENLPAQAALLNDNGPVLVAGTSAWSDARSRPLGINVECMAVAGAHGRVDPGALMNELGARGCNEILVEAGPTLAGALLDADMIDELVVYLAPTLLGADARGMFAFAPLAALSERVGLTIEDVRRVGDDLRIVARVQRRSDQSDEGL